VLREFEGVSGKLAALHEQVGATYMLRALLASGDKGPDARDAIAYYTEVLIGHRSPEGALLVHALQVLDGHISPSAFHALAARAIEGPRHFLETKRDCEACPTKRVASDLQGESAGEALFFKAIEQALAQLQQMSAG
jgi:hypothetical protein